MEKYLSAIITVLMAWAGVILGIGIHRGTTTAKLTGLEQEISGVKKEFKDSDGNPKYVSTSSCLERHMLYEKIVTAHLATQTQAFISQGKRLDSHEEKLDMIYNVVLAMKNSNNRDPKK
jgi:hypothetical protein